MRSWTSRASPCNSQPHRPNGTAATTSHRPPPHLYTHCVHHLRVHRKAAPRFATSIQCLHTRTFPHCPLQFCAHTRHTRRSLSPWILLGSLRTQTSRPHLPAATAQVIFGHSSANSWCTRTPARQRQCRCSSHALPACQVHSNHHLAQHDLVHGWANTFSAITCTPCPVGPNNASLHHICQLTSSHYPLGPQVHPFWTMDKHSWPCEAGP